MTLSRPLPRSFYDRPTLEVARDLLGKILVFNSPEKQLSARIVETEAYIGQDDPACHAARGQTVRNKIMFGPPGFSYVYFIYGMYYCFNVVTERAGFPAAVLVRAAEPLTGRDSMRVRSPKGSPEKILSGPGKLCRSFGLTTEHSGLDLSGPTVHVLASDREESEIVCSRRIGIKVGAKLPYRFNLADSNAISGR
jgi:DNA-3-methyladenine glycosylase